MSNVKKLESYYYRLETIISRLVEFERSKRLNYLQVVLVWICFHTPYPYTVWEKFGKDKSDGCICRYFVAVFAK